MGNDSAKFKMARIAREQAQPLTFLGENMIANTMDGLAPGSAGLASNFNYTVTNTTPSSVYNAALVR